MHIHSFKPLTRAIGLFLVFQAGLHLLSFSTQAQEKDMIKTSDADISIHFFGHGTLMMEYKDMAIHIDPTTREADYSNMPKADLVLITHQHGDHFDKDALTQICTANTTLILTKKCAGDAEGLGDLRILKNGEKTLFSDIEISAVPAYNLVHMRNGSHPYHPKGEGNGYVIRFGDTKIYIAGDTENTPEMKALTDIDIAFLPMNLPYTMTPAMVADAAKSFRPKILYPYHYGNTDVNQLLGLMKNEKDIEIRIRDLQ